MWDIAKIIRFPFLNMTFMTFQERACILQIHGLNLKGREVGGKPTILIKKSCFPHEGTYLNHKPDFNLPKLRAWRGILTLSLKL